MADLHPRHCDLMKPGMGYSGCGPRAGDGDGNELVRSTKYNNFAGCVVRDE